MKAAVAVSERLATRRKEILDAAKKVFEAHGFAAATMEAVAEEARIAKGSIYNYFKSKHELFRAVFLEDMPKSYADAEAELDCQGSAPDKIQKILDLWYSQLHERTRMGKLILEFWATAARGEQDDLAEDFGATYSHWRTKIAAVIEEGVASGDFQPQVQSRAASSLILAVFDGIMLQALLDARMTVDESFVAGLKKAVMAGLTSPREERLLGC
ncbi:MAG: TetR/AcrR family transcriptional regulator [Phycisphaerae bacterium]|nr:TetR/AcrR family transcriptional regulator [Phycisphaerae bacterium]